MSREQDSVLIISDGGLPALVSCMLAINPEAVAIWVPPEGSPGLDHPAARIGSQHRAAVERQADLLGLRGVDLGAPLNWPLESDSDGESDVHILPTSALLLLAVTEARRLGCSDVVWPVVCGADLDELATAAERARLVSRLSMLPAQQGKTRSGAPGLIRIRTPLADLTPQQVAELALDLDAPIQTCWWQPGAPAGSMSEGRKPGEAAAPEAPVWVGDSRLLWEGALRDAAVSRGHAWPPRLAQAG